MTGQLTGSDPAGSDPMRGRIVGLSLLIGMLMAPPAYGKPLSSPEASSTLISMDVTDAYLEDVLKLLSKQSGLNFVASEEVRAKKVTVYLDQVPVQAAIRTILEANHLVSKEVGGTDLFLVTEPPSTKANTVTKIFSLKYARVVPSAGEIFPIFGLTGSLITTTFSSTTAAGTGAAQTSGTTGAGGSALGGALGTGTSGGTSGGGSEREDTEKRSIVYVIRSLLTEHGSVVSDPRTNSIIVTDLPERMGVIEEAIAKLDVKPMQVLIEAEVLEVTLDTLRRLGIEYGDSAGQVASYLGPKRTTFFPLARGLLDKGTISHTLGTLSLADASILLKLLATEKDVKFLARPRLLTLNNEVAEIRIVADSVTGVTSTSQATTGTVTETVERNTVGTVLRVTPLINEDHFVTMVIEPEVSRVIQSTAFTKFLDPNRRAARTTVMVPDGGTVMIAGLISSEDTQAARRIPGLGDIPILGIPFKRTETERKNTEIILFITPHVIQEEPKVLMALDREQQPLTDRSRRSVEAEHRRLLKERAIEETIENILR
ncbi:MAG: hypothetical protein HYZ93_01635 [Candidatus Omnitrophica bacterium]|nr:hypothetical protein [Candidatus Omnitrophota bacterium]